MSEQKSGVQSKTETLDSIKSDVINAKDDLKNTLDDLVNIIFSDVESSNPSNLKALKKMLEGFKEEIEDYYK